MNTLNKDLAAVQLSQVIEQLKDLDNDDTIAIYNDYANENGYELIFDNDEQTLNDTFLTPYDAIRQTNNKDYKDHENYFTFNGYGHAVSFDYRLSENSPIDISELAEWLINEDRLADYDITVTTIDDMLASIEDNISDDSNMLSRLADYLGQSLHTEQVEQLKTDDDYYDYLVEHFTNELDDYSYNDLNDIINKVGIDYSIN